MTLDVIATSDAHCLVLHTVYISNSVNLISCMFKFNEAAIGFNQLQHNYTASLLPSTMMKDN